MTGPAARGRLFVDLVTALEHEMHVVAEVFPSVGPRPETLPQVVAEVAGRGDGALGPEVAAAVERWVAQRRRFDEAVARLEALDHGHGGAPAETHASLADCVHAVRDTRHELDVRAAELRAAVAAALDAG